MPNFCILVGLLGAFAGLLLTFPALVLAVALSIAISVGRAAWHGAPLNDLIWPGLLCIVIIQLGYIGGLSLGAYATHLGRLIASPSTRKFWRQRRP